MIELVIAEINNGIIDLNIFPQGKVVGLCEVIEEVFATDQGDVEASFPALYDGKDHLRYVTNLDYMAGVVFHLPNGTINSQELERVRMREKRMEKIFPLKVIAIIRRDIYKTDGPYSPTELLSNLETKVSKIAIPTLKAELQVDRIRVNVTNSSFDKKAIIEETFINIDFPPIHDLMVVKIDYEIVIQGNEQCFITYGC